MLFGGFRVLIMVATLGMGRVYCLKLTRGNDAFSMQTEQKTVVGLYHSLDTVIRNVKVDVLMMTSSQAGNILDSIEAKRLQTIIDRWTIIESKIENDINTYSASYQQIYREMQINIAASNVLLGYLHVLYESHIVGSGKLAASCPVIWNIGSHFNDSVDVSKSWLYCVIPYGSTHPTYYPESSRVESLVDERLPWVKYAYANTNNHNSTAALLYESLQLAPEVVHFIAAETKNSWSFMLKVRLKLISCVMELLESNSKNKKLKVYNNAMNTLDTDLLLYDKQFSDSMESYHSSNTMFCANITQQSSDGSDSCGNNLFDSNSLLLFMASLIDALKSEIQVETTHYLNLMNVTIYQGMSTIIDEYNQQQTASYIVTPMGFQSRSNVLNIFNEVLLYWESNQKVSHFTTTSRTAGDKSANEGNIGKGMPSGDKSNLLIRPLFILVVLVASGGAYYKYMLVSKTTAVSTVNSKSSSRCNKSVRATTSKVTDHKIKKKGNKGNCLPGKKMASIVCPTVTSPVVDSTISSSECRDSDALNASEPASNDDLRSYYSEYSDNEEEWQISSNKKKVKSVNQSSSNPSHGKLVKPKRDDGNKSNENVFYEQRTKSNSGRSGNDGSILLKQALSIRPAITSNGSKPFLPQNSEKKGNNMIKKDTTTLGTNNYVTVDDQDGREFAEDRLQYNESYDNALYPQIPVVIAPQYDNYFYYNNAITPTPPDTPPMIFYNPYVDHHVQGLPLSPPPIPLLPQSPVGNGYPMYNDGDILSVVRNQIEYYFSEENLAKDNYLKSLMDGNGYVSVGEIAKFRRIQILTQCIGGSSRVLLDAVLTSEKLEISEFNADVGMLSINENQILSSKIRSKKF